MSELRGCWLSVDEICKALGFGSMTTYYWLGLSATFTQMMRKSVDSSTEKFTSGLQKIVLPIVPVVGLSMCRSKVEIDDAV